MNLRRHLLLLAAGIAISCAAGAAPLSWGALQKLPLPPPGQHITYGSQPPQFGELRLPSGAGPFPLMILIHGGCWQAEYDYVYITRLAAWLAGQGMATWTIEYRRIGDDGGGWPGTYLDVASAADKVRALAKSAPIDLNRIYAGGHSAGGQLALWLAARGKLPPGSELAARDPLKIRGVLGLAAITDLEQYRIGPPDSCHASVDPLMGGAPDGLHARYAEASPRSLLPLGVPQVFVQGDADPIVTPASVHAYVQAALAAGDPAVEVPIAGAGHFDTAVPIPASEPALLTALHTLRLKAGDSDKAAAH